MMKTIVVLLLTCVAALAQQTVNNFTVKTNLVAGNVNALKIDKGPGELAGNIRVGDVGLQNIVSGGIGNTVIGIGAAASATNTIASVILGGNAAYNLTSGGNNVVIGQNSLFNATYGNTTPGTQGYTNGVHNQIALGANSLFAITRGRNNFAAGTFSQYNVTNGSFNVSLGTHTLNDLIDGDSNTALGESALWELETGDNNTAVGKDAGYYATGASSRNVYIGRAAGPVSATTENDKLYIHNGAGTPLIGGDFAAATVRVTGRVGIGTEPGAGQALHASGQGSLLVENSGTVDTQVSALSSGKAYATLGFNNTGSVNAWGADTDTVYVGTAQSYQGELTSSGAWVAKWFRSGGRGRWQFNLLPVSASGLNSGELWNDNGIIRSAGSSGQFNQAGNLVVTGGNIYDYGDFFLGNATYTNVVHFYQHQDGGLALRTGAAAYYRYHTLGTNGVATFYNLASSTDLTIPGGAYFNAARATNLWVGASGTQITSVRHGTGTLTAGSVAVSASWVTANTRIIVTSNTDGGTPGWLRVSGRSAGTSFTVTSSSGTDTSTFAWVAIEP